MRSTHMESSSDQRVDSDQMHPEKKIIKIGTLALRVARIVFEFIAFYMQQYLTSVWKLSYTHAAGILNIWNGVTMLLPVLYILIIIDHINGYKWMVVLCSMALSLGIAFIAISTPPALANLSGTCKSYKPDCIGPAHKALFYTGLVLSAVGMAGQFFSIKPFLKDHGITNPPKKYKVKIFVLLICVPVIGGMFLLTKSNVPWSIMFGIPAICNVVALALFLSGWKKYNAVDQSKNSSPEDDDDRSKNSSVSNPFITVLTTVCRVLVASARKICTSPKAGVIYKENAQHVFSDGIFLRLLEKAAIARPGELVNGEVVNKWKLCSLEDVEHAKDVLSMAPFLVSYIICGIVSSVGNTYFLEQANSMDQKVGKWKVPFTALVAIMFLWWGKQIGWIENFYRCIGKWFCCSCIDCDKIMQILHLFQAAWCATLCCIIAALVETRRLKVVRKHDLVDVVGTTPMSVFWLVFQFWMLSGLDASYKKGIVAFFKMEAPIVAREEAHETTKRVYHIHFYKGIYGVGYVLSVVSVQLVSRLLCRIGGARYWFQDTLNKSRLDRYYWFLAVLSALNLIMCVWVMYCRCIQRLCSCCFDNDGRREHRRRPHALTS